MMAEKRTKKKKRTYYAFRFMLFAEVFALALLVSGFFLRRTLLEGMPQYDSVATIALPMLALKDHRQIAAQRAHMGPTGPGNTGDAVALTETGEDPDPASAGNDHPGETDGSAAETPAGTEPQAETAAPVTVDEHYFDNTLFIGDSRTEELRLWGNLGTARYFCGVGFSVFNIFGETVTNDDFSGMTLDGALAERSYDQIYIQLGYNESGYPYDSLMSQYTVLLDTVREAQPDARIVLHAVMHASRGAVERWDNYAPENLDRINAGIAELATSRDHVYYVDVNDLFTDENGYMREGLSNDGEHLDIAWTEIWAQALIDRAIMP